MNSLLQTLTRLRKKYFSSGRRVSGLALQHMHDSLLDESVPDTNFFILILGSCIIATFGLLSNSAAVIIGAMLIAPLMLPIRGVAFGILGASPPLIRTGARSLSLGTAAAIAVSALLSLSANFAVEYGSEVLARSRPTLLDLGIAITAGALAGVAKVEPKLSNSLAGTAIAVALMPPLCVAGLWLAQWEIVNALNALLLYATNLLGITLSCMVAFWLSGYVPIHQVHRPLRTTLLLTLLLAIPLGYSSLQLWRQNYLEANLRRALLDRTVTFQRLRLVSLETNWLKNPPEVNLTVYANSEVTPVQVELLEEFLAREMGRPFQLVFQVSQLSTVTNQEVQLMEGDDETPPGRQESHTAPNQNRLQIRRD